MSSKSIQKWLKEKPNDKTKKTIKEKVYPYLLHLNNTKGRVGRTKDIIPGFIKHLGAADPRFYQIQSD